MLYNLVLKQKSSFKHLLLCILSKFSGLVLQDRFDVILNIFASISLVSLYNNAIHSECYLTWEECAAVFMISRCYSTNVYVYLNIICITLSIYIILASLSDLKQNNLLKKRFLPKV